MNPESDRDWKEDFNHENGNYRCICCHCGNTFSGHKRRVVCKICAAVPEKPVYKGYGKVSDAVEDAYKNVGLRSFKLFRGDDGKPVYDHEAIASYLLFEGVLFLNTRKYQGTPGVDGQTTVLFVNCNDLLCPAADAEDVEVHELPELCRLYTEEENGILKWVAAKRGVPPVRWRDAEKTCQSQAPEKTERPTYGEVLGELSGCPEHYNPPV
jgi:hypothetical protein